MSRSEAQTIMIVVALIGLIHIIISLTCNFSCINCECNCSKSELQVRVLLCSAITAVAAADNDDAHSGGYGDTFVQLSASPWSVQK